MRVSIWQQFSSNHSGYFWTAGTFKTLEESRSAYSELRHILFEIDRWHREHKEASEALAHAGNNKALPPEVAFAVQYNVEWPHTIDWMDFRIESSSQKLIEEAVNIVGRVVTVSNPDQTWMTTQPFQALLERLGAKTVGYDIETVEDNPPEHFELHSVVRFTAPDQSRADEIENAMRTYLNALDSVPPWHDDEANFRQIFGVSKVLRQEDIDILKKNWQRRYQRYTWPKPSPYGLAMPAERLALRSNLMTIVRDNLRFTLIDIWFHNQELGLYALFAYLEVLGCTDIDFEYSDQALSDIT